MVEKKQKEILNRLNTECFFNYSLEITILKDQAIGYEAFGDLESSSDFWVLINWLENERIIRLSSNVFSHREN